MSGANQLSPILYLVIYLVGHPRSSRRFRWPYSSSDTSCVHKEADPCLSLAFDLKEFTDVASTALDSKQFHLLITVSEKKWNRMSLADVPSTFTLQALLLSLTASRIGDVHLFVRLSVCLSVCCQNTKTRFSQKLSNLEPWSLLTILESRTWAF